MTIPSGEEEAGDMPIRVTPPGSRGARVPTRGPLAKLFKLLGKRQIRTYRRGGEQRVSSKMGFPVVLLTTRGARTGQARTTPIGGFPDGENSWLVAATFAGAARHPAWFLNMAKHPDDVWLEVGTKRFKVRGESLEGPQRAEALARIAKVSPRYGKYQEKTDREIPVVRLTRETCTAAAARSNRQPARRRRRPAWSFPMRGRSEDLRGTRDRYSRDEAGAECDEVSDAAVRG
jgi:deazaflavin-dependent oxidoreductase (nitroreductase family)